VGRAAVVRIAALTLLWGSGFFWIKLSLRGWPPTHVLTIRLALGALVLCVACWAAGGRLARGPRIWAHLAVAGAVGNVVPYLLFGLAERAIDSSVAGMLNATTPLWTVLLAVLTGQESRPGPLRLAGVLLGFVGVMIISSPWPIASGQPVDAVLACLAAALCYGVTYVYLARYLTGAGLDPPIMSASQLVAATVLSLPLVPLFGGDRLPVWRTDAMLGVVVLGVLGTGVAYLLNYRIVADVGASAGSLVVYLLPIVALGFGIVLLGETPTVWALVGSVVVLAGVAMTQSRSPAREPERTSDSERAQDPASLTAGRSGGRLRSGLPESGVRQYARGRGGYCSGSEGTGQPRDAVGDPGGLHRHPPRQQGRGETEP
jgi:drug/metabolite transporter (DMT)-like permease